MTSLKKYLAIVSAVLLLMLGSYALGRWMQPAKIVTRETVRTETKLIQDTKSEARIAELSAQLETAKRNTHIVRIVVRKPDGTRTSQTMVDTSVVDVKEAEQSVLSVVDTTTHNTLTQTAVKTIEKIQTRNNPSWFIGAAVDSKSEAGVIVGHMFGPVGVGVSVMEPWVAPIKVPTVGVQVTLQF